MSPKTPLMGEFEMELDFEKVRDEWEKYNKFKNEFKGG